MPYIAHDKIKEFIKLSASPDAQVKLIEPLPKALEQHGQTCKLYALSVVMNWRYISTKTAKKMPPPARKRDSKAPGQMSLRKEAKQYGSKIGEIYDPEILIEIAKNHGYENSQLIEVSANDYIANLQNAINANHPAIVYFDADPTNGDPIYSNSAHEHSAVIVGYYTDARDRLQFIANQWGGYYALDANQLQASANQLAPMRQQEVFFKIDKRWRQENDRFDRDREVERAVKKNLYTKRIATTPLNSTFRNRILIIDLPRLELQSTLKNNAIPMEIEATASEIIATSELSIHWQKKFILLEELINFIEIDNIRPDSYSDERLKELLDTFAFEDEITTLTKQIYNAKIDGTLDDDIHKQNPKLNRSITETVSNAIDAKASRIDVILVDSKYSVSEVDGVGMGPVTIIRKLNLPKSTSKEGSTDNIGRFGLGFYTSLAHLDDLAASVVVTTKENSSPAYRLEYRNIHGKIRVNIALDPARTTAGTTINVKAASINAASYAAALIENVKFHAAVPIYVNGQLINNLQKENSHAVSQSIIYCDPFNQEKSGVITIGGITIRTYQEESSEHTMLVVWDLPREVTLSESRDQVRIDNAPIRAEICRLIDFGKTLPQHLQIKYFNTIAPMIANLQEHNTSKNIEDDVLEYLQETTAIIFKDLPQVPDLKHLALLQTTDKIALHPLILAEIWQDKVGYQPDHWSRDRTALRVIVIPMNTVGNEIGFIHDDDTHTIYIDKNNFEKIVQQDDIWKLASIFKHPQDELKGHWSSVIFTRDANNIAERKAIIHTVPVSKHHALLQKHGHLDEIGDDFISTLTSESMQTLNTAMTLMQSYPNQPIKSFRSLSIRNPNKLIRYFYAGKLFYLAQYTNEKDTLLNSHFQPLLHFNDLLLLKKIKQLNKNNQIDCEVTLTDKDRLLIHDDDINFSTVFDGTGKKCIEESFEGYSNLELKNSHYYLIRSHSKLHVYHMQNGLIKTFSTKHSTDTEIFSSSPLIFKYKAQSNISLYDVADHSEISFPEDNIQASNNFYVAYQNEGYFNKNFTGFSIYDSAGILIFKYKDVKNYSLEKIWHVECQEKDAKLYISIVRHNFDKKLELLISPIKKLAVDSLSTNYLSIENARVIGFPIVGYIRIEFGGERYYQSLVNNDLPLKIQSYSCYETENPNSSNDAYYSWSSRVKTVAEQLNRKVFYLTCSIDNKYAEVIIDDTGNKVTIPKNLWFRDLKKVNVALNYYLLEAKSLGLFTEFFPVNHVYLLDKLGNVLALGQQKIKY